MKGNFLRVVVIWFVGLGLILSVGGILYTSWENSQVQEKVIRKQTLDIAKQLLDMHKQLSKNGEISKHILDKIIDNQDIILKKIDDVLKSQIEEMTLQIRDYLKESRSLYLEEFGKLKEDFKVNRGLHKETQRFLGIKNDSAE